ncbi:MerR family transcriptional regulator [Thermodesulfobacteriota bacterium]
MEHDYSTKFVRKLTGATENQLKYWVKIAIVTPKRIGKSHYYSFRDIVKLRVLALLRQNGLSLQKVRRGIDNLSRILPDTEDPMTRLMIHTDGIDMIVVEKGNYFSAITRQQYFIFDTGKIKSEMIRLQTAKYDFSENGNTSGREKETLKTVEV